MTDPRMNRRALAALAIAALALAALAIGPAGCGTADEAPSPGADDPSPPEESAEGPQEAPPVVAPGGTDVWIASLDGDGTDALRVGAPENATARPDRYDNQPHFLPDGSALLYTAGDEEGRTDTHVLRLPGGDSSPVTRTATESEYSPTPLPDGGFSVIRVEADGTQRLWRFEAEGTNPSLLLPDVAPVGYQGWIDRDRVAVFVLGEPATLHVARVPSGEAQVVFEGIGPSIQPIPGRDAVSFVEMGEGESWIREYDGATGETARIIRTPDGGSHHAWTPSGVLLMASGRRIMARFPGETEWRDVGEVGPAAVVWSRLAVSPAGELVALVGEAAGDP